MRSTRVAAAWAGIAMATSFLSVTIIGTQPNTRATRDLAQSVAMTSTRDALSSQNALKRLNATDNNTPANAAP